MSFRCGIWRGFQHTMGVDAVTLASLKKKKCLKNVKDKGQGVGGGAEKINQSARILLVIFIMHLISQKHFQGDGCLASQAGSIMIM
jgi:hypothetical protein